MGETMGPSGVCRVRVVRALRRPSASTSSRCAAAAAGQGRNGQLGSGHDHQSRRPLPSSRNHPNATPLHSACPCSCSFQPLTLQVLLSPRLHSCRLVAVVHKCQVAQVQHSGNGAEHSILQHGTEQALGRRAGSTAVYCSRQCLYNPAHGRALPAAQPGQHREQHAATNSTTAGKTRTCSASGMPTTLMERRVRRYSSALLTPRRSKQLDWER